MSVTAQVSRRALLRTVAAAGAGVALAGCTMSAQTSAPAQGGASAKTQASPVSTASGRTFTWKMQSTWTAGDFHQNNPADFVNMVGEMSGGRLKIELMPAGAVVPALEVLDAVHKGLLDAGHAWPGYWYGKHPAATLFASAPGGPFGMNNEDFVAWMLVGGGTELYNELLQSELKLNVVAIPSFGEVPEPLGWFPKEIKTVDDLRGLKFRATGMSAEVFKELGMSVVTLAGGETIPAIERKVVDAAEYSEPSSDLSMGFQDVLKFYHLPGIHQPTGIMEVLINRSKYEELPEDLKATLKYAGMAANLLFTAKLLDQNNRDLETLVTRHGVKVIESPREVLIEILKAWDRVAERYAQQNAFFKKVLDSQRQWAQRVVPYRRRAHPDYAIAAEYYWGRRS